MGALFSRFFAPRPDALKVGDEISRGAYGTVYRGALGTRPVAIKKIHQLLLDCAKERREELEGILKRFRDECELMEAAKHENVVEFIGVFEQDDSALLVMELMHQTLEKFLEKNRETLLLSKQVRIILKIALGLSFLHHHDPQILHRDLTAKNVLMNEDGSVVKISDLGQAKFRPSSVMYLTTKAPGCIAYMPPECLVDRPHFTDKGDVFSLGVVALQVCTQEPPSVGFVIVKGQPEVERRSADLVKLPANHPLKPPILQCLQDDPAERPSSGEVVRELQAEVVSLLVYNDQFYPLTLTCWSVSHQLICVLLSERLIAIYRIIRKSASIERMIVAPKQSCNWTFRPLHAFITTLFRCYIHSLIR